MWIVLAIVSSCLLGCYDTFKKQALRENAVLVVLFIKTLICASVFSTILLASSNTTVLGDTIFEVGECTAADHLYIFLKSIIVLSSWVLGYFAMKNLPLTLVGPINATRPVITLVGALLVFGEQLNLWQWAGVMLTIISFYLLKKSSKKEGIIFRQNKWVYFAVGAALLGAMSGLYDKYLMSSAGLGIDRMAVQAYYNIYQFLLMGILLMTMWYPKRATTTKFRWDWCIVFLSVFLIMADFAYFYALSLPGVLISVVTMVRRSSVLVSFFFGAFLLKEKNLKAKAFDLLLVLLGLVLLAVGSL